MDYIIPLIGGITCKLFDDLDDNNFLTNDLFREFLKGIQWITLTLMSYNDFNFSVVAFVINVVNAISNWGTAWNNGYEKSLLILYPVFLFLSYSTRKKINLIESLLN